MCAYCEDRAEKAFRIQVEREIKRRDDWLNYKTDDPPMVWNYPFSAALRYEDD